MNKITSILIGCVAGSAMAIPVESFAVEYGPQVANIWGLGKGGTGRGIGRIDIDDQTPGQETFIPSYEVTTFDPDGDLQFGNVQAEVSIKTDIRDKDGAYIATVGPLTVRSLPYPEPCLAANTSGGSNAVVWFNNWLAVQTAQSTPCADNRAVVANFLADQGAFNAAIGNSNGERTLMFGLSIAGYYFSPNSEASLNTYGFFSYDADNHNWLCGIWRTGTDNDGYEIEPAFSGVGPYLDDGVNPPDDVLRIAYAADGYKPGQLLWRYEYYDIRTCSKVQQRWAKSPAP